MDADDVKNVQQLLSIMTADLKAQIDYLRAALVVTKAERDAGVASERRLWAAYGTVKGAAERAAGVLDIAVESGDLPSEMADAAAGQLKTINADIVAAQKLAGVAVES